MKKYKLYMLTTDPRASMHLFTWFRYYKNFSTAQGQLTRAVNRFYRVYGVYPYKYGVETLEA